MNSDNPNSKIRGSNNNSGIIYNRLNGSSQYNQPNIRYPKSSNVYAKYQNEDNVRNLLKTGRDGKKYSNKKGLKRIPDLPNKLLSDGGFGNRGKVEPQVEDPNKVVKLAIPKNVKKLARQDIGNLPLNKEGISEKDIKTLDKFNKFISSMKGS